MTPEKHPAIEPRTQRLRIYPHDGTCPVIGGRELVLAASGRMQHIVPRRCANCNSLYKYMTQSPMRVAKYCPACRHFKKEESCAEWKKLNIDRVRKNRRDWSRKRYQSDPEFRRISIERSMACQQAKRPKRRCPVCNVMYWPHKGVPRACPKHQTMWDRHIRKFRSRGMTAR